MLRTLIVLLTAAGVAAADDAVRRIVDDAQKAWQVPGGGYCIVRPGTTSVASFGVRELGSPVGATATDVFPIASCTKAFTAALLAQLVDEGGITWDDPVRKHLDFHLSDPNADALVTLRDLLTHRTGVGGHDLLWYHSPWSNSELLRRTQKLPLQEPFRGAYQYSSLMYVAAGEAAAKAAGKPWHEAVRDRIVTPLEMKHVTFSTADPAFKAADKLTGHRRTRAGGIEIMPRYEIHEPNPAGSINLSLLDLSKWLQHQLRAKNNLAITHSPQMVIPMNDSLRRQHPDTVQMSYAMGWIVADYRGVKTVAHGGMIDGFRTLIMLVPDRGIAIAVVANLHETKFNAALANGLLDHCLGLPPKDWNAIHLKAVADEKTIADAAWEKFIAAKAQASPRALPLADYAGSYTNPAYGTAKLTIKDGKLHWDWSTFQTPLDYWGNEAFLATSGVLDRMLVEFQTKDSKVKALRFQGLVFPRD